MPKKSQKCMTCGGTGWQWLNRSWYTVDGKYKIRCGVCSGTGESDYHNTDAAFVRAQKAARCTAASPQRQPMGET